MPLHIITKDLYQTSERELLRPQIAKEQFYGCDEPRHDFAKVLAIDVPERLTEQVARTLYTEKLEYAVKRKFKAIALPLIRHSRKMIRLAVDTISTFLNEHDMFVCLCIPEKVKSIINKDKLRTIKSFLKEGHRHVMLCERELEYEEIEKHQSESINDNPFHGMCMSMAMNTVDFARLRRNDKSFREKLFDWIDKKGMTDVECYKKANVDRRTFSKIKNVRDYSPSRQTAVAFAIALELDLNETLDLLEPLGLTLSNYGYFDLIIRYFINEKIYDVHQINETLYEFDQPLLGYY